MIIKNLSLKNFRKFKDVTIEFPDGVTGIVGLNGVGKSTIFEAIAWVLYGSVAARTSADQIKLQSSKPTDSCLVVLEFVFEEENYRIFREMSGKYLSTSATATVNGKIAATGAETVSKFVQKKLGMDFKSFFTSIFAKQKELNVLSSMNASERRPLILKMLGIDSLDDVIKEIKSDKKEKDSFIEKINDELIDENGKEKILKLKDKLEVFKKQKIEYDKVLKDFRKKIDSSKKEIENIEKKFNNYKKEYEKIKIKKEKLTDKKDIFEDKKRLKEEVKKLNEKINERQKIIDKEKKKLKEFKDLEKDIKFTEKQFNENKIVLEKIIKIIEKKKTLKERIVKDIEDIELKSKKIKKLGSSAECPTCERVLSDQYHVLINKFKDQIKKFEVDISSFDNEIKKEKENYDGLIRRQKALEKKKNYYEIQYREKEKINTTINNILRELNQEKTDIDFKNSKIKKIGEIPFNVKEFENVKKQIDIIYKNYQSYLSILNEKKDNFSKLNIDLERKESEKKLISQEIKNLNDKIGQLEDFKNKIKQEKKTIHYLTILTDIMSSFRIHLISRIRPTLSSYSSDFFERLTDGKYREIELDENYSLMVYDDNEAFQIERFSGGEEDLANLCLRLAISEVITERSGGAFNFIILDEIFGSQDINRRQNIMKALNSLSSKFRQIFLITHIDDIKNYVENIINVNEDENGISKIKLE